MYVVQYLLRINWVCVKYKCLKMRIVVHIQTELKVSESTALLELAVYTGGSSPYWDRQQPGETEA